MVENCEIHRFYRQNPRTTPDMYWWSPISSESDNDDCYAASLDAERLADSAHVYNGYSSNEKTAQPSLQWNQTTNGIKHEFQERNSESANNSSGPPGQMQYSSDTELFPFFLWSNDSDTESFASDCCTPAESDTYDCVYADTDSAYYNRQYSDDDSVEQNASQLVMTEAYQTTNGIQHDCPSMFQDPGKKYDYYDLLQEYYNALDSFAQQNVYFHEPTKSNQKCRSKPVKDRARYFRKRAYHRQLYHLHLVDKSFGMHRCFNTWQKHQRNKPRKSKDRVIID